MAQKGVGPPAFCCVTLHVRDKRPQNVATAKLGARIAEQTPVHLGQNVWRVVGGARQPS